MKQIRDRVAELDVHRDTVVACCRVQGPSREVKVTKRSFRTTSKELAALAEWLIEVRVTTVVMEATGVHWKPQPFHRAPIARTPTFAAVHCPSENAADLP